jgi:hypothetical protein
VHAYILLISTGHALRAEKVLQSAGIKGKLVPVPRHISSECGVCLRVERGDVGLARHALETAGLEIEGLYE